MKEIIRLPNRRGPRLLVFRSRFVVFTLVVAVITCCFFFSRSADLHIVPYGPDKQNVRKEMLSSSQEQKYTERLRPKIGAKVGIPYWELTASDIRHWHDPDDHEDPNNVEPGTERDGQLRDEHATSRLQDEKNKRKLWRYIYQATADLNSSNQIYGKTLATLHNLESRSEENARKLVALPDTSHTNGYSKDVPVRFNPYPAYNSKEWLAAGHASYTECNGANGKPLKDIMVFKGRPSKFPSPVMGSYESLSLDPNLCWERDNRLGPYGLVEQTTRVNNRLQPLKWENVNWGKLQRTCVQSNAKRYSSDPRRENPYLAAYEETKRFIPDKDAMDKKKISLNLQGRRLPRRVSSATNEDEPSPPVAPEIPEQNGDAAPRFNVENRTALLLRSYTGKRYTESDKQNIRSLISELCLKSGGEYEVFLFVQVKDNSKDIFGSRQTYVEVLKEHVPAEFHGITVLWNDEVIKSIYTEMDDDNERSVHTAQWLSVQKFSHDHPQFEYIWNWEMDFRHIGHHYDILDNIHKFARKQPRKGLWERNERWYIPKYHGDYDTTFRKSIERQYGDDIVWGAPDLPFITPQGPKPPTKVSQDNYEWGVGEDADVITLGPMFNPVNSLWIIGNHIWGYSDDKHRKEDLPRRTTIITHSRVSKRLLNLMHVENMRGNHVASEMTPQTVALIHGLKGVFAPHPIFMDRDWTGSFLNKWFNAGPGGVAGGYGSAMGWGRERRYQGTTWYYRAEPPNRLFNNWMGWTDTGIGGASWEEKYGRPCLPSVMLHPIKDSQPTDENHATGFELAYG